MATEQTPLEPDPREPRWHSREFKSLLWLGGWGGAAAIALTALAVASQTKTAGDRLRQVFAINEPAAIAQMPPRVTQLESNVQLLSAQVRALTVERDRLAGRIALLESSIDDMTGAIKKQAAATAAALAAKAATPAPSPPATTPVSSPPVAAAPVTQPSATMAAPAPKADAPSTTALPLPPTRIATVSITPPPPSGVAQNEFGLDLGGATTLDGIRQRWITVKASFGPLLSGMHPLAAREHRAGASGYRLVVGPLPNSPAATGLCAHFAAARTACKSVKFDGEQLAEQ
jgi:hypothetical protein